ncbi:ankyrin repeat, PH and SEC7 domain containing protein secG-like [Rhincodon typus]|uniref:ankyrin repeat, PH and SEC7 domain containing protein secG-like n=1 Tax=Rhincodon typus TaxID=259920 RepID=UPI00202F2D37|nr:ankyrin repeat, PH and SEC7 domain containing protein secG-like [Rhincodon typus]
MSALSEITWKWMDLHDSVSSCSTVRINMNVKPADVNQPQQGWCMPSCLTMTLLSGQKAETPPVANQEDNRGATVQCQLSAKSAALNDDCKDNSGWTPLHHAAFCGNISLIKYLLHRRAAINSRSKYYYTAMHRAAYNGHTDAVDYLLHRGALLEPQTRCGASPLHCSAAAGCLSTAQLLIKYGASADIKDNNKWTPLHWACLNGHTDLIELLLKEGSSLNEKTDYGMTPLQLAVEAGNIKATYYLLKKGADIEARDENNQTALHKAAANGNMEHYASCRGGLQRMMNATNMSPQLGQLALERCEEAAIAGNWCQVLVGSSSQGTLGTD